MSKKKEKVDHNTIQLIGRVIVNGYYDYQGVRIALKNNIRDIVRKRAENIQFNEREKEKEQKSMDKKYNDNGLMELWADLLKAGKISQREHDYMIECWDMVIESEKHEKRYKKAMKEYISTEPIWEKFLSKIRGIGEVLAANLIKSFGNCEVCIYDEDGNLIARERDDNFEEAYEKYKDDPEKYGRKGYYYVSKLHSHCGYDVVNGKAPRRRKGKTISYNPTLRTMVWKISNSLMKLNKGYYRQLYETEKHKHLERMNNSICKHCGRPTNKHKKQKCKDGKKVSLKDFDMPERFNEDGTPPWSRGHAHNRALRKVAKHFLDHYWHCSRELDGLPAEKNYVEGVLKHKDIVTWKDVLKIEKRYREKKRKKE